MCFFQKCFGIISLLVFPLIHGSHLSWFLSFVEKSRKCVVCGGGGTAQKKKEKRPDDGFLCRSTSRRRRERYAFLSSRRSSCDLASWQSARCRQDLVVILTHSFSSLDLVHVGAKIFKTKCAQCHVAEPGGGHKQVRLRVSFGHKRTGTDEIAVRGTRWTRFGRFEPSDRVFTTPLSLRYSRLEFVDRWSR